MRPAQSTSYHLADQIRGETPYPTPAFISTCSLHSTALTSRRGFKCHGRGAGRVHRRGEGRPTVLPGTHVQPLPLVRILVSHLCLWLACHDTECKTQLPLKWVFTSKRMGCGEPVWKPTGGEGGGRAAAQERGPLRRSRETRGMVTHRADRGPHLSRAASQPPSHWHCLTRIRCNALSEAGSSDLNWVSYWLGSRVHLMFRSSSERFWKIPTSNVHLKTRRSIHLKAGKGAKRKKSTPISWGKKYQQTADLRGRAAAGITALRTRMASHLLCALSALAFPPPLRMVSLKSLVIRPWNWRAHVLVVKGTAGRPHHALQSGSGRTAPRNSGSDGSHWKENRKAKPLGPVAGSKKQE